MGLIAEILIEIVLALGIFLFQWCARHKEVTLAVLAAILVVIDIIVLVKIVWGDGLPI